MRLCFVLFPLTYHSDLGEAKRCFYLFTGILFLGISLDEVRWTKRDVERRIHGYMSLLFTIINSWTEGGWMGGVFGMFVRYIHRIQMPDRSTIALESRLI